MSKECCGSCRYHSPQDGVDYNGEKFTDWYCVNADSEYCTDVTPYDHYCEQYDERG